MTPRSYVLLFLIVSLSFRLLRLVQVIKAARASGRGKTSAPFMFRLMTVAYFIFIGICLAESFSRQGVFSWTLSILGLFIYIAALSVRELAMRDLGRFFSPDIEIRQTHRVIREGLYRYVRHPLLSCMGFEILGLGLVFNAFYTLAFIGIGMYFPLIAVRKTLEEKALIRSLGEAYRVYQREVGTFLPRIDALIHVHRGEFHV